VQANNEYVEPINLHPDEFEDDDLIYLIRFGNITSEFNRSITPTATEDLKVGDIIKSKVKLLQIITEWSIKRGVPFAPVKTAGCRTPREGSDEWSIDVDMAPRVVPRGSINRCTSPAAFSYIFNMIGTTFFPDYSTNMVYLRLLPLFEDFDACGTMSWGSVVILFFYRKLYKVFTTRT